MLSLLKAIIVSNAIRGISPSYIAAPINPSSAAAITTHIQAPITKSRKDALASTVYSSLQIYPSSREGSISNDAYHSAQILRDASISTDIFIARNSYPSLSAAALTTHIKAPTTKCRKDALASTAYLSLQIYPPSKETSISTDTYCTLRDKSETKKYPLFETYPSNDASTNTYVKYPLSNDPFAETTVKEAFPFAEITFKNEDLSLESSATRRASITDWLILRGWYLRFCVELLIILLFNLLLNSLSSSFACILLMVDVVLWLMEFTSSPVVALVSYQKILLFSCDNTYLNAIQITEEHIEQIQIETTNSNNNNNNNMKHSSHPTITMTPAEINN